MNSLPPNPKGNGNTHPFAAPSTPAAPSSLQKNTPQQPVTQTTQTLLPDGEETDIYVQLQGVHDIPLIWPAAAILVIGFLVGLAGLASILFSFYTTYASIGASIHGTFDGARFLWIPIPQWMAGVPALFLQVGENSISILTSSSWMHILLPQSALNTHPEHSEQRHYIKYILIVEVIIVLCNILGTISYIVPRISVWYITVGMVIVLAFANFAALPIGIRMMIFACKRQWPGLFDRAAFGELGICPTCQQPIPVEIEE